MVDGAKLLHLAGLVGVEDLIVEPAGEVALVGGVGHGAEVGSHAHHVPDAHAIVVVGGAGIG